MQNQYSFQVKDNSDTDNFSFEANDKQNVSELEIENHILKMLNQTMNTQVLCDEQNQKNNGNNDKI